MFFTAISQMMTESVDLTLVIRKSNGQLTVSTLPKANGLKDEAANLIIPLTLTGTPEEMDAEFLQQITQPISKTSGLLSNMVEFEKRADVAAANSKAEKETKAKEAKEENEKCLKKAEELISTNSHREAVAALQQARTYATGNKLKEIDEKIAQQQNAMNQGSLFDSFGPAPEPPATEQDTDDEAPVDEDADDDIPVDDNE